MWHRADEPLPDTRRSAHHRRGPDTGLAPARPGRGTTLRTCARAIRRDRFAPSGIAGWRIRCRLRLGRPAPYAEPTHILCPQDRKSTRLNSSHMSISYAVFCLKKKKKKRKEQKLKKKKNKTRNKKT